MIEQQNALVGRAGVVSGKEVPRDGEDTLVEVVVVEGTEESRGHIKITIIATRAQVNDLSDFLIAVLLDVSGDKNGDGKSKTYLLVGDADGLATVVIGVEGVLRRVEGDDELFVGVLPATGTDTDRRAIEGSSRG